MKIDHIVYAAPTLEQGIAEIEEKTGMKATYGGKHMTFGTHNALIKMGALSYFEIIAVDPENTDIKATRWMGVDLLNGTSAITRLALKTDNLERDAFSLFPDLPKYRNIQSGTRKKSDGSILSWRLTLPLSAPKVDLNPFLLEWDESLHPALGMQQTCTLLKVNILGPETAHLEKAYSDEIFTLDVSPNPKIQIVLDTPKGEVTIS